MPDTDIFVKVPVSKDYAAWVAYWQKNGQAWRSEPEISEKRKELLAKRRAIMPNIKKAIYPYKRFKLNRADVEWLLATHESGQGPVDWLNKDHQKRKGLDLRGANLSRVDLHGLPLAGIRFGLSEDEWFTATSRQWAKASAHLEGANLSGAHLEGANLSGAHLEGADFFGANLKGVYFHLAILKDANLHNVNLSGAKINKIDLHEAKVAEEVLNAVNEDRSIVPRTAKNRKLIKLLPIFSNPLLLLIVGAILANYLLPSLTQRWQDHQKALDIKTSIVSKMSSIVSQGLTELELIQGNGQGTNSVTALAQFYTQLQNFSVNASEMYAEIKAYYNNAPCDDITVNKEVPPMVIARVNSLDIHNRYNHLSTIWSNYTADIMPYFFDLSLNIDKQSRLNDVEQIQSILELYNASQTPESIWQDLAFNFKMLWQTKDSPTLVSMKPSYWKGAENTLQNFEESLVVCALSNNVTLSG